MSMVIAMCVILLIKVTHSYFGFDLSDGGFQVAVVIMLLFAAIDTSINWRKNG